MKTNRKDKSPLKILILAFLITYPVHAREYHVAVTGNDNNGGTVSSPYRTISRAAQIAQPGDEIVVHSGIYRERDQSAPRRRIRCQADNLS